MFKRFCCSILIGLLIAVPISGQLTLNVYADSVGEDYLAIDHNDMTQAFLAYCKARDITLEGEVLDAVTSYTSSTFSAICKVVGIDFYQLQAEIHKVVDTDSNIIKYFVFTSSGINGFNRICAQLLTDFDLETGDEDVDKIVKSGRWFQDLDGHGCWVYESNASTSYAQSGNYANVVSATGTPYIFNWSDVKAIYPNTYTLSDIHINASLTTSMKFYMESGSGEYYDIKYSNGGNATISRYANSPNNSNYREGFPVVCHFKNYYSQYLWLGCMTDAKNDASYRYTLTGLMQITDSSTDTDVTVVSPKIKDPLPEDPTNIAPNGNYTPSDQDPTEPPPDPTGGTPPDWGMDTDVEPDGEGGWKIPFSLPNLDIDWSIEGLSKKFPFSIPFDVYHLCSVLNAAPVAPHFIGQLDLKVYVWDIDIDLSEFDNMAAILRTMELIGFVIGLAMITRQIIKG